MLDLMKEYRKAKKAAVRLMKEGKLNEYVQKLTEVQTLRLQLINARA